MAKRPGSYLGGSTVITSSGFGSFDPAGSDRSRLKGRRKKKRPEPPAEGPPAPTAAQKARFVLDSMGPVQVLTAAAVKARFGRKPVKAQPPKPSKARKRAAERVAGLRSTPTGGKRKPKARPPKAR